MNEMVFSSVFPFWDKLDDDDKTASCLLDSIQFDIFIETAEKTEAVVIPTTILNHIMEENPYVGLYMYQQATERFSAEEGVVTLGRGRIEITDKEKLKTYL